MALACSVVAHVQPFLSCWGIFLTRCWILCKLCLVCLLLRYNLPPEGQEWGMDMVQISPIVGLVEELSEADDE